MEVEPIEGVSGAGAIRIRGPLTLRQAPAMRLDLLESIGRHDGSKLVLELAGIERIDTSGAAVLAEALKFGLNQGLHVLLCSPSESVMDIFRLAGFEDVLDHCCADPQETHRRLQV